MHIHRVPASRKREGGTGDGTATGTHWKNGNVSTASLSVRPGVSMAHPTLANPTHLARFVGIERQTAKLPIQTPEGLRSPCCAH